ncbi:hypothetical protein BABINDRAFT_7959 [Babjeviella inositovora NRRL Y-12698]|uniref:Uncharacterized protein n=1 Tax=Babjeviella inositovora NRRL Y-12698 TaxID=984486 RepID=A0A1E3QPX8_9ASCO|nr:uncharacterized protein BABINDRAFT_7959 [Babjeviella inositovora NRRL Y-12698]ODQ79753.1 hypothetical protein BABINDRAFT_7959 [Babjeviella inositovora NRRL Y-12698]
MLVSVSRTLTRQSPLFRAAGRIGARFASDATDEGPARVGLYKKIGVGAKYYVPPSFSKYPSFFSSPVFFIKTYFKRWGNSGLNWFNFARAKRELGHLDVVDFRHKAIDIYMRVHTAFASNNFASIDDKVATMVKDSLVARRKDMAQVKLDWTLVKFNQPPKLVSFNPIPGPSGAIEMFQMVYKFDTNQRLIIGEPKKEIKRTEKDSVDYFVFTVDPFSDDVVLAGSLFESSPADKIMPEVDPTTPRDKVYADMVAKADIFRL